MSVNYAQAALEVASRIEAEKRAELEAPAKALKAKIIVDAEAKVSLNNCIYKIQAQEAIVASRAQAEALFNRMEAEARGLKKFNFPR